MLRDAYYKVVHKVIVSGFYKAHAGALFFFFSVILFYFFFIGFLDVVPSDAKLSWNLVFARLTLTSWWMTTLFCILNFLYIIKSWQYVFGEFSKEKNYILSYCSQCIPSRKLLLKWTIIQCWIMLPLFVYCFFVACIAFLMTYSFKIVVLFSSLLIGLVMSAVGYVYRLKQPINPSFNWNIFSYLRFYSPHISTLFLRQVIHRSKLLFILTKTTSWILILGTFISTDFGSTSSNYNFFVASVIAMANSLLVFKEYQFTVRHLYWIFNFPQSVGMFYIQGMGSYVLFLLPEMIWMLHYFPISQSLFLLLWTFSILMLYRSILYTIGDQIKRYLRYVFLIFIGLYLASIYGIAPYMIPLLIMMSFYLWVKNFPLKKVSR